MRRITLSSDIDVPPWPAYATAEDMVAYHAAVLHARAERGRHDAWHATFNACMCSGRGRMYAIELATLTHGQVKIFGTDEIVC